MKNLRQYLKIIYCRFPLIFLLGAIFYPFVANLFFSNTALLDNRALKTKPQKFTSHFSQEFTDYYNDTFAGREKLIVKYIKLQQKLQLDTGQYFYGQKGWMFYDSIKVNNGNTILDYLGNVFLENDELEKLKTALEEEKSFYEQNGAKYLLMVVPNKENVYAEYMPERLQKLRKSDFSLSDAGMKYLQDNTTIQNQDELQVTDNVDDNTIDIGLLSSAVVGVGTGLSIKEGIKKTKDEDEDNENNDTVENK